MHVSDGILNLFILGFNIKFVHDLGPVDGTLDDPIADDHPIAEVVLIGPCDLNIDEKLFQIPSVEGSEI